MSKMIIIKIRSHELMNLYNQGLTDRQIAEELNVTQAAVNYRREQLGLENNFHKQNTSFTDKSLIDLYNQGLTDRQIAEELNVTQAAVNYRRGKLGLPSHWMNKGEIREAIELYITKHKEYPDIHSLSQSLNMDENVIRNLITIHGIGGMIK